MAENTAAPPYIKFYQNHRPEMDAGDYTITVNGAITHSQITGNNTGKVIRKFSVYGQRFSLTDQDIKAVFPAAGSTGEYAAVLPHVIVNRNTLPWERHAVAGNKEIPWLALLLFDENETPEKKIVSFANLATSEGAGNFAVLSTESGQENDEQVTVIDVHRDILKKILPATPDSLKLMAHTRQGVDVKDNLVGEENAVVFCNRLPQQGKRSTMHLVSVESRYNDNGFDDSAAGDLFRLVSLKSWEFYTLEHFKITTAVLDALAGKATKDEAALLSTLLDQEFAGTESSFLEYVAKVLGQNSVPALYKDILVATAKFDKTFDGLLKNLNRDIVTMRLPVNADKNAELYLSQGLVPLAHHFRNGDESVSWYRGPLSPVKQQVPDAVVNELYPETSDDLLQFDNVTGMFDVSYSSAWEIGRLLALSSKDFSVHLYQWKRLVAQHQHKARQSGTHDHMPVFSRTHNHELEQPIWDKHLQPWLTKIKTLQNIPANYLVPADELLPKESIRFFYVDKNWVTAALCGAFSVGGNWDKDDQMDDNAFTDFLLDNFYVMGFVLRSDVVAGWPGLIIEGQVTDDDAGEKYVPLRRQLSGNIMLCMFNAEVKKVIFHQKPEVMHFGLDKEPDGSFTKKVRNPLTALEEGNGIPVTWQNDGRVIDIISLAASLGKIKNPAQFAMNMIEGVPKVIFTIA